MGQAINEIETNNVKDIQHIREDIWATGNQQAKKAAARVISKSQLLIKKLNSTERLKA